MKQKTKELLEQAEWEIDDQCVFTSDQIVYLQRMLGKIKEAIECETKT